MFDSWLGFKSAEKKKMQMMMMMMTTATTTANSNGSCKCSNPLQRSEIDVVVVAVELMLLLSMASVFFLLGLNLLEVSGRILKYQKDDIVGYGSNVVMTLFSYDMKIPRLHF